jgi:hypothetical protein
MSTIRIGAETQDLCSFSESWLNQQNRKRTCLRKRRGVPCAYYPRGLQATAFGGRPRPSCCRMNTETSLTGCPIHPLVSHWDGRSKLEHEGDEAIEPARQSSRVPDRR